MATASNKAIKGLIEKLENWVVVNRIKNDPYLTQLIKSLKAKKNLHIYAELDPMAYLPHIDFSADVKKVARLRLVTVIRNVLVFAPVALTWAAVSASTQAFAKYTKENALAVTNYLDFWQNGYGYLPSHWKIASVATLDFLIILAVIVLTVYVSIQNQRMSDERKRFEDKFDAERADIALEIATILHDKKKISSVTISSALAGSVSRLVNATKSLEAAAKNIEKVNRAKK